MQHSIRVKDSETLTENILFDGFRVYLQRVRAHRPISICKLVNVVNVAHFSDNG